MRPTCSTKRSASFAALLLCAGLGCSDRTNPTSPRPVLTNAREDFVSPSTAQLVRQLAASRGIVLLPRAPHVRPALVRLGQAFAFDKILSGNYDIFCMTCHLPAFGTGDGKSLSIGQGGEGLGPARSHPNSV